MKTTTLPIHLNHLEKEDQHLIGELDPAAMEFMVEDEMIDLDSPLTYDLEAQLAEDDVLVTGTVGISLRCQCVRCLQDFEFRIDLRDWAAHLPIRGEDKVEISGDTIDLLPIIREDVLLAFPQHPLCSPDCTLKNPTGASRGSDDESAEIEESSSPWSELDNLKMRD